MRVKVVSWNIWLGRHYPEIIAYLREQSPDIIGLQELAADEDRDQANQLARELGCKYAFYPAFEGDINTEKGDAVLSRFPILSSKRHFLSPQLKYDLTPTTEPRIAVEADLAIDGTTLSVYSAHLSYAAHFATSAAQTAQAEALVRIMEGREKALLMGDFNALPNSATVKTMASVLRHTDSNLSTPTFTMYPHEYQDHKTAELRDRVDYIFASADIAVLQAGVGDSQASNHLPVWAVIEV